jgi:hypothetical protein
MAPEIALHEVGRETRCEQIQWPDLFPTATDHCGSLVGSNALARGGRIVVESKSI